MKRWQARIIIAILIVITVIAVTLRNYGLSTTISLYEKVQISSSIAGILIALGLFWVAYSNLRNAQRHRRQRYLEIQLKEVYTPLFEILTDAKNRCVDKKFSFEFHGGIGRSEELSKIIKIFHEYSHYIDADLRWSIRKQIIEANLRKCQFTSNELSGIYEDVLDIYANLREELEKLSTEK